MTEASRDSWPSAEGRPWALSVGAGPEQVAAIERAMRSGLKVLALDGSHDAVGFHIADAYQVVDISDELAVIDMARRHGIEIVLPAPLGRLLTTVGAVNDALDLPGITRIQASRCVDKHQFADTIRAAGLVHPSHHLATTESEIVALVPDDRTVILKPLLGAGSVGVLVVEPGDDVYQSVREHLHTRPLGQPTLVTEFVEGREFGVDVLVRDGVADVVLVRDKLLTPLPHRQELAVSAPADIDSATTDLIHTAVQAIVDELALHTAPMNLDVIVGEGPECVVVDCAPRPSGMYISTELIPMVRGCDLVVDAIADLRGLPRPHCEPRSAGAVLRMLPAEVWEREDALSSIRSLPDVQVMLPAQGGTHRSRVTSARDVLGNGMLLVGGASQTDAWEKSSSIIGHLLQR